MYAFVIEMYCKYKKVIYLIKTLTSAMCSWPLCHLSRVSLSVESQQLPNYYASVGALLDRSFYIGCVCVQCYHPK